MDVERNHDSHLTDGGSPVIYLNRKAPTAYIMKRSVNIHVYPYLAAVALSLLLIGSCSKEEEGEVLKRFPDGTQQEVVRYEGQGDNRQMVLKTGYYRSGAQAFEEHYQDGVLKAYQSWWEGGARRVMREYQGGEVVREEHYDADGVLHLTHEEIEAILQRLADYPGEPATAEEIVTMETSAGTMKLRLFTAVALEHCNNFKRLANIGFYDSTTFHRVIPRFMIQGGDIFSRDAQRANDGQGGPGYRINAEFNPRLHVKGTLAMARSQDPNSAGSQFYIALGRLTRLDNQYTVFGELIDGMDVLDSIAAAPTDTRDNPVMPQRIFSVRVQ